MSDRPIRSGVLGWQALALLLLGAIEGTALAQKNLLEQIERDRLDEPVQLVLTIPKHAGALYQYANLGRTGFGLGYIETTAERRVCLAPCHIDVPRHGTFFVDGPAMVSSAHFTLPETGSPVEVDVAPGSLAGRVVAAVVFVLGVGAVVGGIYIYTFHDPVSRRSPLDSEGQGTAFMVTGGAAMVGGVVGMILTRTRVGIHAGDGAQGVRVVPSAGGLAVAF